MDLRTRLQIVWEWPRRSKRACVDTSVLNVSNKIFNVHKKNTCHNKYANYCFMVLLHPIRWRKLYMSMQPTNRLCLCRYNDFQHDPLAKCNCTPPYSGENGISARSDLNPANGTYPFSALGHRSHGGTDNKVRTGVRRLACILYYRASTHKERSCC